MKLLKNPQMAALYKQLIQEAERFPQYNYRMYALRKIKDTFETNSDIEESKIPAALQKGKMELERLRRMTTISSLYAHDQLIIEKSKDLEGNNDK